MTMLHQNRKAASRQARKVVDKFGGVSALVMMLGCVGYKISRFSVYKWMYPKISSGHGGTDGVIPADSLVWVRKAARTFGIYLTVEDLKI